MAKKYWLIKSEPNTFSLDDLKRKEKGTEPWDGIRNYQARNFMRDEMKVGDLALFYHSSCKEPGAVGLIEIVKEAVPDHTAWDKTSPYFDPKSSPQNPRWVMIYIRYLKHFPKPVGLKQLKACPELSGMRVVQKGQRLSLQPVEEIHFNAVCQMGGIERQNPFG